jgi:hypothetical protein
MRSPLARLAVPLGRSPWLLLVGAALTVSVSAAPKGPDAGAPVKIAAPNTEHRTPNTGRPIQSLVATPERIALRGALPGAARGM